MTHYRAAPGSPDQTGEVAPAAGLHARRFQFLPRLQIQTKSGNKGGAWVKFITLKKVSLQVSLQVGILPPGPDSGSISSPLLSFVPIFN